LKASKRSPSSEQIREAVDFESLPSAAFLAERLDASHREAADEGADDHRLQRPGAKQLRRVREQRRHERLGGLAHPRDLDPKLALCGLHPPRAIAVSEPRVEVAKPALIVGPTLIAGAPQPGVELVLDRALDDQPGTELRQLRQRLARVLADSDRQQPVELGPNLRRRR
jgi:hypothetical protein